MALAEEMDELDPKGDELGWRPGSCSVCTAAMDLSEEERDELVLIFRGEILSRKTGRPFTDDAVAAMLRGRGANDVRWSQVRACRRYHHGVVRYRR